VSNEPSVLIPTEVPEDPIYFKIIEGRVHIPEVVLQKFKDANNNIFLFKETI
jgi:hypothetical protein